MNVEPDRSTEFPDEVRELAQWTPWRAFNAANVASVPARPGVYLFRQSAGAPSPPQRGDIVYVGRAGERGGKGVRERLRVYVSGRAPHSGLGNLAFERALSDADWLRERLDRVEAGEVISLQRWAREAVEWADLEFSTSCTTDGPLAEALEAATIAALHTRELWNRRR